MKPKFVYESKWLKYINRWPSAITLYPFILFKWTREEVKRSHVFKHEMHHWYRARREGWFVFLVKYLIELFIHGYKRNKYEIAARKAEVLPLTPEEMAWRDGPESRFARAFDWALTIGFVGVVALFVYSLWMFLSTNGYMG